MIRFLMLLVAFASLAGCVTRVPTTVRTISQSEVDAFIQSKVGSALPDNFRIRHSYTEKSNRVLHSSSGNWSCNGSRFLKGESIISLNAGEGNSFSGTITTSSDCGAVSNRPIAGRYDKDNFYFHFTDSVYWIVSKYKILNGGRIIQPVGAFNIIDSVPTESPYWVNGQDVGDSIYNTTGYISTDDEKLGQATEPVQSEKSLKDKLKELKELTDSGIISKAEYESKKRELLEKYK